jgi:hypothetical protein
MGGQPPSCPACTEQLTRAKIDRAAAARRTGGHLEAVAKARQKKYNLLRYNLTVQEFEAMLTAQDGRCALCGSTPPSNGKLALARLHVDHDHITGKNRGLLCTSCNNGLGRFKDDPALLRAAADYIDHHREGPNCA